MTISSSIFPMATTPLLAMSFSTPTSIELILTLSDKIAIVSAGILFLTGLLTGVWKYWQISRSETAKAHIYVDIAHRSSLMYAFASILVAVFSMISQLSAVVEVVSVLALEVYFMLAVASYIVHGLLQDTRNQLEKPHKLGKHHLPNWMMAMFMWSLVVAEIAGFLVLFYGACIALL